MKRCNKCMKLKELDNFSLRQDKADSRAQTCKDCVFLAVQARKKRTELGLPPKDRFEIAKEVKETQSSFEEFLSNELLTELGYDLNSELTVHEQFMIKFNLI